MLLIFKFFSVQVVNSKPTQKKSNQSCTFTKICKNSQTICSHQHRCPMALSDYGKVRFCMIRYPRIGSLSSDRPKFKLRTKTVKTFLIIKGIWFRDRIRLGWRIHEREFRNYRMFGNTFSLEKSEKVRPKVRQVTLSGLFF